MSFYYKDDGEPRYGSVAATAGVALVALIFVIALIAAFPFQKTPQSKVGLSYGGGFFEGEHFQKIVQPGSGLFFNGWGDRLYLYPVTQRNYIISKKPGEGDVPETDYIAAPTADRIEVQFEVAVYFKLNLDKLREFHEEIGLKYRAWTDEGWLELLHDSFRQQIEFALQREARQYDVADIYANKATLEEIQSGVGSVLKENVERVLGDEYFCGPRYEQSTSDCDDFTFVIKRITVPDSVKNAFESNRTSEIAIVTRENEVRQAELQAEAIDTLNAALSSAQSADAYVLLKAIEAGTIDFWVIPDGRTTLTLPARTR